MQCPRCPGTLPRGPCMQVNSCVIACIVSAQHGAAGSPHLLSAPSSRANASSLTFSDVQVRREIQASRASVPGARRAASWPASAGMPGILFGDLGRRPAGLCLLPAGLCLLLPRQGWMVLLPPPAPLLLHSARAGACITLPCSSADRAARAMWSWAPVSSNSGAPNRSLLSNVL